MQFTDTQENGTTHRKRIFRSIHEIASYAEDVEDPKSSHSPKDADFNCFEDFPTTARLCRTGWTEGARSLKGFDFDIAAKPRLTQVMQPVYDVAGGMVDVSRFNEGIPECMMDFRQQFTVGDIIRIVVNIGAPWMISDTTLLKRGAAITALIRKLEMAGKRVHLDVVMPTEKTDKMSIFTTVKKPDQKLSVPSLAMVLAASDFMRRICFAVMEREDNRRKIGVPFGYGRPCCGYRSEEHDVTFPGISTSRSQIEEWETPEEANARNYQDVNAAYEMIQKSFNRQMELRSKEDLERFYG